MARMKPKAVNTTVLFDVFYEDGGRASNRKVPGSEVGGLDGDEPAAPISKRRTGRSPKIRHSAPLDQEPGPLRVGRNSARARIPPTFRPDRRLEVGAIRAARYCALRRR